MADIQSKDDRRAIILADVLEKTARVFQQKLTSPKQPQVTPLVTDVDQPPLSGTRPISAPLVQLEEVLHEQDPLSKSYEAPPTKNIHSITVTTHHPLQKTKSSLKKRSHIKVIDYYILVHVHTQVIVLYIPFSHTLFQGYLRYRNQNLTLLYQMNIA